MASYTLAFFGEQPARLKPVKFLRSFFLPGLMVLMLQACGQKGPLILPQPEQPAPAHTD